MERIIEFGEQGGIMLGQSVKSSEPTDISVWLIICIVGFALFGVYVAVQSLLPLD
jgi:hypothetical protein